MHKRISLIGRQQVGKGKTVITHNYCQLWAYLLIMKEPGKGLTSVLHSNIVRKVSLLNWLLLFVLFPRNLKYHLSDGADEISTSFFSSKLTERENKACWLRSWVQTPLTWSISFNLGNYAIVQSLS